MKDTIKPNLMQTLEVRRNSFITAKAEDNISPYVIQGPFIFHGMGALEDFRGGDTKKWLFRGAAQKIRRKSVGGGGVSSDILR